MVVRGPVEADVRKDGSLLLVNDFAPNTFRPYNFSNYCLHRFINTVEAVVSDHLGNSNSRMSSRKRPNGETIEGVTDESFRNSVIIHKEITKEILKCLMSVFISELY